MTETLRPRPRVRAPGLAVVALALAGAFLAVSCRRISVVDPCRVFLCDHDGIVRSDTALRRMSLIFTGGSFGDGG
ncbi:MAG: hypothetical protein ACXWIA_10335, partial [Candidatus Aminicenantales bacterium]